MQEMVFTQISETNKININVMSTEWSLKHIVNSFSEDENYIFISKFVKTAGPFLAVYCVQ